MKKNKNISNLDLKEWQEYIKNPTDLYDKESIKSKKITSSRFEFDLHGFSLDDANKKVKSILESCFKRNYKEILLITGKGIHSKKENVYTSKDYSKLKHSIPNYIKSSPELISMISEISEASPKEGGSGALLIKLKKL